MSIYEFLQQAKQGAELLDDLAENGGAKTTLTEFIDSLIEDAKEQK